MSVTLKTPSSVPSSEWDKDFLQGMVDRMAMSYFKYGAVKDAAGKIEFIKSALRRLDKYEQTGNTEWLIDAANYMMIEFMFPTHPEAHFKATDSRESPGRYFKGEVNASARKNTDF